jgi:hypothetical protein
MGNFLLLFVIPEAKGGGTNLRCFPNLGKFVLIPDSLWRQDKTPEYAWTLTTVQKGRKV